MKGMKERKKERKRERENEKKKEGRTIQYFHFMSRSVFMPQILAPTRGRLRFLPVESSPIFTTRLFLSLVNKIFSQISGH